tara:strand:- start:9309 stop:9839 length:531 start_codon:yes stop_codon:yes gene_type:complete
MNINFIQIENFLKYIPEDVRDKFSSVDWTELNFITYDIATTTMTEYEISEDLGVYVRKFDESLEKVEDFTHKLDIETGVILEKEDYEIMATAYIFKGELKEVKVNEVNFVERKDREEYQKKLEDRLEELDKQAERYNSKWFKVWDSIVSFPLSLIRYALGALIKLCWKIQKILTGT